MSTQFRALHHYLPVFMGTGWISTHTYLAQEKQPSAPAVYIRDYDAYSRKVSSIVSGGSEQLMVMADFDYTLTPHQYKGKLGPSCHGAIVQSNVLGALYNAHSTALFEKYYPMESSPFLSLSEKFPLMETWWKETLALLIAHDFHHTHLATIVNSTKFPFRQGFHELMSTLNEADIPLLIFSAGIADIIREVLIIQDGPPLLTPNVHVVSNLLKFNDSGKLIGLSGKTIHVLNKSAGVLIGTSFFKHVDTRRNVLLMGDSLGDANMSRGLSPEHTILKIGYLHDHVNERLEAYMEAFDVVVVGDGSLSPAQMILDLVHKKKSSESTPSER